MRTTQRVLSTALVPLLLATTLTALTPSVSAASAGCALSAVDWSQPTSAIAASVDVSQLNCTEDDWKDAAIQLAYYHMDFIGIASVDPMGDIAVGLPAELNYQALDNQDVRTGQAHVYATNAAGTMESMVFIAGKEGSAFIVAVGEDTLNADRTILAQADYVDLNLPPADGPAAAAPSQALSSPAAFTLPASTAAEGPIAPGVTPTWTWPAASPMFNFGFTWNANAARLLRSLIEIRVSLGTPYQTLVAVARVTINSHMETVSVKRENVGTLVLPCASMSGYINANGCTFPVSSTAFTVTGYLYDATIGPGTTPILSLCSGGYVTVLVWGFGINHQNLGTTVC